MVLQVQRKAARQQLQHVTNSFALICSKFQDRFQSEELDNKSAFDMLAQTKLDAELEEARHEFCLQQQTVQETAILLDHCKEGTQRQRVALAGTTFLYHIDTFSRCNTELPSSPGLIGSLSLTCWVLLKQT